MKSELGRTIDGNKPVLLPDEAVTQGFGILATRGAGKSVTAGVMEEIMCARRLPWVALDPASAHWGIVYNEANGRPGKPSGLEVLLVGGKAGHVPLDEHAGGALAEILVETDINCVVDLKLARYTTRKKFVADFANRLFEINEMPRHIFLEEAHEFVPQQLRYDEQKDVFAALERVIKGGRGQGLGFTLISQRPAEVSKAVLELIDNLIVMRTNGPRSIAAAKDWIETNLQDAEQIKAILASLPRLHPGEAWLMSPFWLEEITRFQVRERFTYHAGRTPKVGEKPVEPKRVELGKVIEQFREAATSRQIAVTETKSDKARIKELEAELRKAQSAKPVVAAPLSEAVIVQRVDRAVKEANDRADRLNRMLLGSVEAMALVGAAIGEIMAASEEDDELIQLRVKIEEAAADIASRERAKTVRMRAALKGAQTALERANKALTAALAFGEVPPEQAQPAPSLGQQARLIRAQAIPIPPPDPPLPGMEGVAGLRAGVVKILHELAMRYPLHWTKAQVAALTKYAVKGGTFTAYIGELRRRGFIEIAGNEIRVTDAGLDAAGEVPEAPATHEAMMEMWSRKLRAGCYKLLQAAVDAGPEGIDRASLAESTDYEMKGGTFGAYIGELRRNGLIEVSGTTITATSLLWPEGN